ncbi:MAG: hypothetical protein ACFFEL_14800 [Candidatus Thorarchaeota archaeon]
MTSREIARGRMIFKVLVVGSDLPLQTGFLSRSSGNCISYQLYNALGVTLGVSRFEYPENQEVILQLWSLPSAERVKGITSSYVKGHKAIVLVVRPNDVESIPFLMQNLSLSSGKLFMVVVVGGSVIETEDEISKVSSFFESQPFVQVIQNADDAMKLVADHLVDRGEKSQTLPIIASITEDDCPPFEPQPPASAAPPNSDSEVGDIREIALDFGLRIIGDFCAVEMNEGTAWINMRTGSIRLEPQICKLCLLSCKRKSSVCIVGIDSGWSSEDLRSRALLTIAKIHALAVRTIPQHVEKQINTASECSRFQLNPEISIEDMPDRLLRGFSKPESRKSLLEVARDRVKEGKLSETGYSILKKKLHNLEASRS